MKRKLLSVLLCLSLAAGLAVGCGAADKDAKKEKSDTEDSGKKVKIGMTLYSLKNEYTVRLANAAEDEAEKLGIELTVYDGNYDASTKNDKLTSYVGSEDVKAGEMETQALLDKVGTDAKIVIIEGPMGQSAQIERREGIQNILDKNPGVEVLAEKTANWSRSEAMTVMETWLQAFDEIDGIIGENDEMALGAREAVKAANKDIPAVGVDGITDALDAVEDGNLVVSIFQNADGQARKAVQVLMDAVNGKDVDENYWIEFEEVNKDNVADFRERAQ